MDYSGDELFLLLLALIVACISIYRFWIPILRIRLLRPWPGRAVLAVVWIAGIAFLCYILTTAAARSVREDASYIFLFLVVGIAWQGMVLFACRTFGISWRADALERRNPAALFAISGAMLGGTILFSLANIGEGDTIWTTIGPACLATCLWFAAWICLEAATHVSEAIVVERDTAVGFRLGALLLANGAILGRSVAGDWNGTAPMLADLAIQACPVVILTAMAMMLQTQLAPAKRHRRGLMIEAALPAALTLFLAIIWLWLLGVPA